jgi:hypothetical protein
MTHELTVTAKGQVTVLAHLGVAPGAKVSVSRSPEIIGTLRRLVAIRAVEIECPAAEAGIAMLARGGDFADGVVRHEADRAKCDRLVTFVQSFARLLGPDKVALLEPGPRREGASTAGPCPEMKFWPWAAMGRAKKPCWGSV